MIDYKKEIAKIIGSIVKIDDKEIKKMLEKPANNEMGDFSFPCFKLAKELKKSPMIIAQEICEKMKLDAEVFENIEIVNGYINFFVNKERIIKEVLEEVSNKKEEYGKSTLGAGQNIIVEYSSPNIAKPFHIGHLRNTVIGSSLYNMYKYLGYNTIGINHL